MAVLWQAGPLSVREIQAALPEARQPAYSTVQTIVQRLVEKGAVSRVKKIGNAYLFAAAINRQSAFRRRIDELLELLGGSPKALVSHLVETGQLSLGDIRELEAELQRIEAAEPSSTTEADKNETSDRQE